MGVNFKSYKQLRDELDQRGGVATVEMTALRQVQGADRLGAQVRGAIIEELRKVGVSHAGEFPQYSEERVRLYVKDSPIGHAISALDEPGEQADERLRELTGGAQRKLEQIRSIVNA